MANKLTDEERAAFEAEASRLREEHRDLDAAIDALEEVGKGDQLQIQRLKKRKLKKSQAVERKALKQVRPSPIGRHRRDCKAAGEAAE